MNSKWTRMITIIAAVALIGLATPATANPGKGKKPATTSASASVKRPNSRKATPRKVAFRVSPVNQQKRADMKEMRKNFRPSASHKMKRRTADNTRSESSSSAEAGTSRRSTFDSRRGARDFNDSRTKRYGQRDLPTITTTDAGEVYSTRSSMRSSVSSVLTRQPMSE